MERFLRYIMDEFDRILPGHEVANFFTSFRSFGAGRPPDPLLIRNYNANTSLPPGYRKFEEGILERILQNGPNLYRFIAPFPKVWIFSVGETFGYWPDTPEVLTFIDGRTIDRNDPRAVVDDEVSNREQYDLVGYTVYTGGHYKAVVKHPDTGNWFEINDAVVRSISGHDPQQNNIMRQEYLIANIMYSNRRDSTHDS